MYNTWHWHLETTVIDDIDEYIMENKGMATLETYKLLKCPDLLLYNWLQQMRKWVTEPLQDLIHCLQQQCQGRRWGHINTQWEHETKYLVWYFIATLACIHLCFWHRKRHFLLTIPRGQWWHKYITMFTSYDTTGIVTETVVGHMSHGDSGETYDTTGTVLRWWSCRKTFLMTETHDKRCRATW